MGFSAVQKVKKNIELKLSSSPYLDAGLPNCCLIFIPITYSDLCTSLFYDIFTVQDGAGGTEKVLEDYGVCSSSFPSRFFMKWGREVRNR